MRISSSIFLYSLLILLPSVALADRSEYPLLNDTDLYTKIASGCRVIEIKSWNHPIKKVFSKYEVEVGGVELCNNGKYPIFHVRPKYDPDGYTHEFYGGFHAALLRANGKNPLSMVDEIDEVITNIALIESDHISVTGEMYRSP